MTRGTYNLHVKCDIYITTNNFLIVLHWCRHRVNSIQKWKNSVKTIELSQELVILTLFWRSIIMTILTNSISIQFLHFFGFNALWARKGECWNVCWKPEHQNSLKWNLNRHLTEQIPSLEYTTTSTYHLYTLLKFSIVVLICKYTILKSFQEF